MRKNDLDKISLKYKWAFVSLFGVILIAQILIQFHTLKQESNGRVINLAGRQRMIVQKIAKLSLHKSVNKTELQNSLNLLINSHGAIQDDKNLKGIAKHRREEIKKNLKELDKTILSIKNSSTCIILSCTNKDIKIESLLVETDLFSHKMNSIVFKLDLFTKKEIHYLSQLQFFLFLLITLIMSLEFFKVITPAKKTLIDQVEALESGERHLNTIEEVAIIGSWEQDVKTRKVSISKQLFLLFEIDEKNFNNNKDIILNAFNELDREKLQKHIEDCINKKTEYSIELETTGVQKKWIRAIGKPIIDSSGQINKIVGVYQDITHIKNAQNEIVLKKKMAEHNSKLASIGELAAGVGHEINNPLAIVLGHVKKLREELTKKSFHFNVVKTHLNQIQFSSERIQEIVLGLRNFSRQDNDETKALKLVDPIKSSISMLKEIYLSEGVIFFLNEEEFEGLYINGSNGKIQQVLVNLFSNAKDATEGIKSREIRVNCKAIKNDAYISISDNGAGIPRHIQSKIFEAFFTTKDINKGTGIGLSMVHSIIHDHGGSISLRTKEGEGTTFTIRLPLIQGFAKDKEMEKKEIVKEENPLLNANIILVDDEEGIREILGDILMDMGLVVKSFSNAKEALDEYKANQNKYELIVSDMRMPNMTGEELLKSLRSNTQIRQPKFILITGGTNVSIEKNSEISNLIDGYFFKPFDEKKIYQTIKKALVA